MLRTPAGKTNKHNHTSIALCYIYIYIYIYTMCGFYIKCGCGLIEITRWLWLCVNVYYIPQFVYISKYISCCWYYSSVNYWIVWIGVHETPTMMFKMLRTLVVPWIEEYSSTGKIFMLRLRVKGILVNLYKWIKSICLHGSYN